MRLQHSGRSDLACAAAGGGSGCLGSEAADAIGVRVRGLYEAFLSMLLYPAFL